MSGSSTTSSGTPSHEVKRRSRLSVGVDPEATMGSKEVVVNLDKWKVDFTELPPQRLMCTVCNRVFRDPYAVSCCKKTFCLNCIQKKNGKTCPAIPSCGKPGDLEIEKDGVTQQSINELYVRCIYVTEGCMWFGRLEFLPKHLDITKKESQGGCVFAKKSFSNDFEDKSSESPCKDQDNAPLLKKDTEEDLQKSLTDHSSMNGDKLEAEEQVPLPESPAATLPTQDAPTPKQNGLDNKVTKEEAIDHDYEKILQAKDIEIKQMKSEISQLRLEKEEQGNSLLSIIDSLRKTMELQEQRLSAMEDSNKKEISRLKLFLPGPLPLNYTINKFDQLKQTGKWWYSRPFHSHFCGYKFGMFVFCNGVLDGKGSHISVFLYLVRGEYDDELEWPFRGSITVQLLNQRGDRGHHQKTIKFSDETPPTVSNRVVDAEMAKEGNGPTQFISHSDLTYNPERDTEYVRDDCIRVRISAISIKGGQSSYMNRGMDTLSRERRPKLLGSKTVSIDSRGEPPPASPQFTPKSPSSPTTPSNLPPLSPPGSSLLKNQTNSFDAEDNKVNGEEVNESEKKKVSFDDGSDEDEKKVNGENEKE